MLEAARIPSVVVGSALDIVEHCGVPRFVFTDIPLGNPCGQPYERAMQMTIVQQAIDLLEHARQSRTLARTPFGWGDGVTWRADYARVGEDNKQALHAQGERRRAHRAQYKK